jgi:hypothetical protein
MVNNALGISESMNVIFPMISRLEYFFKVFPSPALVLPPRVRQFIGEKSFRNKEKKKHCDEIGGERKEAFCYE